MHHSSALQACIAPHACTSLKISQQQREPARPVPIRRRERCGGRAQPTGVPSDDFRHCGHGVTPFRTAMPIYTAGFNGGSRRGGSPASRPVRLRPGTFCTKRRKTVPTPSVSPSGDGGVRRTECRNASGGLLRLFAKTQRSANRRRCKTAVSADFSFCKIMMFCKWKTPIYDSSSHGHPLCFPTPAGVLNFLYVLCPRISPLLISEDIASMIIRNREAVASPLNPQKRGDDHAIQCTHRDSMPLPVRRTCTASSIASEGGWQSGLMSRSGILRKNHTAEDAGYQAHTHFQAKRR